MVGIPRSKGCQTCLKRRTKCDEAVPQCANCVKYGVVCPGYDRGFKFVAGKHVVRSRGKRHGRGGGGGNPSADAVHVRRPRFGAEGGTIPYGYDKSTTSNQNEGTVVRMSSRTTRERIQLALGQVQTMPCAPRDSTSQFVGALMESLQNRQPHDERMMLETWIFGTSSRLSNSLALDTAVCSFALHLLGKMNQDQNALIHSRVLYGKSLQHLQKSINHREDWRKGETLGASMILCFYELFAGTSSPDCWMKHATGVGRLIQLRGPKAHEQGWEKSMLLSFQANIIMNDLFSGRDCFLADESWQNAMCHDSRTKGETIGGNILNDGEQHILDRYTRILTQLPTILRHAYALREANKLGVSVDMDRVIRLGDAADKLRQELQAWYSTKLAAIPGPVEVPSKDPTSIFSTVFEYETPWKGSLHMGYWASMLILQETLVQCGWPADFAVSNKTLALNILRSVETVSKGIMGSYRCGYGVRIAYEFADDVQKAWIGMWLNQSEKEYAATSASLYPP